MITKIEQDIKGKIKGTVLYNEPMSRHTSFRIGGPADIWIEPRDLDDLKCCVQLSSDKNIPLFVIGSGTNLLVKDEGIRGIVLNMRAPALRNIHRNGVGISAASSVTLGELLDFCSKEGFGGMEFLSGIPGTVGGAVGGAVFSQVGASFVGSVLSGASGGTAGGAALQLGSHLPGAYPAAGHLPAAPSGPSRFPPGAPSVRLRWRRSS